MFPIVKTMQITYPTYDSITHERIYPGDLVEITFRRYYAGIDETTGKKIFRNKYRLIERSRKRFDKNAMTKTGLKITYRR